jgi:hypothetical protein
VKSPVDEHAELVQQVNALTERATRVSTTLAEAGRGLMQRRTLPPESLADEIAAVHADFTALRDRVVAAATSLAAGTPPPITTLRELEVLVKVLVDDDTRRARRHPTEETPPARPVVEAKAKTQEAPPRKAQDEPRRKAAEAEQEWGRAEAEAKRRSQEEAQRRTAEEARHKAEAEARHKAAAEEEARRKGEDEARRKAVEAEGTRRLAAEAEAKRKADEEVKRKAEEAAKRKAEEAAKRKADEEARHRGEEETKRKAEEEARRKAAEAEEARRKTAAADAKRKADQEAQQETQRRATEEAKRKTEEEARRKAAEGEETRRKTAAADAEAKRKADQEAQQEAQRQAAAEAEDARRRAEQEAAAAAADPAATEDDGADAGLETAQWWISASASWGSMRSKKVGFAAGVGDVLTKYPYFLSVPIQTSADYEDGMLAYGYGILLEHIEQHVNGFVADALARLPARSGVSLGKRLYDYLAQALGTGYGEFIKTVMLAAIPRTPPWATGGIEDSDGTTTVFIRPSARIGDTHQKAERFTQASQRFGEHHFTAAVPPLTTRFFRIEALDVKEARHLGLRISEKGVPSDQAWVVTMSARGGAPQAKRHAPQGTAISGIGRDTSSVWVGLFNADAENEKRYDVAVEVTRRQPGAGGFRKSR